MYLLSKVHQHMHAEIERFKCCRLWYANSRMSPVRHTYIPVCVCVCVCPVCRQVCCAVWPSCVCSARQVRSPLDRRSSTLSSTLRLASYATNRKCSCAAAVACRSSATCRPTGFRSTDTVNCAVDLLMHRPVGVQNVFHP